MVLAAKLKKVVAQGVFGEPAHVSEVDMRAASLTLADQSCNENTSLPRG